MVHFSESNYETKPWQDFIRRYDDIFKFFDRIRASLPNIDGTNAIEDEASVEQPIIKSRQATED